jgi:hypothetical protein
LVSQNPVLRNITDYLIEEASAEEEELLGQASETEDNDERDQGLIKVMCELKSIDLVQLQFLIYFKMNYQNRVKYLPNSPVVKYNHLLTA